MTKHNKFKIGIVIAILLIIYHLIAFITPLDLNNVFWLSYLFTMISFAIGFATCIISMKRTETITSKLYGFPILKVAVVYIIIQIICSMVLVILNQFIFNISISIAVIVYAIILGIAVIGLVITDTVREYIERQDEKFQNDVKFIVTMRSSIKKLAVECKDSNYEKEVEAFSEALRFSDPVSSPYLLEIENNLKNIVDKLHNAVLENDSASVKELCRQGIEVLNERNRLCKLSK